MGKKTEKKRDLKLKNRAQAAKSGTLATKKKNGQSIVGGGRKGSLKKQTVEQVLQGTVQNQSKAGFAPPKINAMKQLSAIKLKQKREELRQMRVSKNRVANNVKGVKSLEELMGNVQQSATQFEKQQEQREKTALDEENSIIFNDNSRRAYMKELRKVIDRADVVLEVLDARDPLGCRSIEMEEVIAARGGKKVVFVLNKIDLVPPEVLQPWLNYLRTFYPTVAFKASTQNQSSHLSSTFGRADKAHVEAVSGSRAVGTEALMQLLKNYCRNSHIKTAITVGVIGYPNVGKSSVINSLKRSKAASVSSTAGHTKVMQEIHIDSKVKLLDCPGIVFDHTDSNALLLRNCINTESMNDPIAAVEVILSRCEPHQIQRLYQVSGYGDVIEFLVALANAKGKLGKGGIPDRKAAARIVLQDWNRGKIPFFTPPPDQKKVILDTQIVTEWSNDFEIDTALNPTSIFLPEHAELTPEETTAPVTSGPKCSIQVDQNSTCTMSENAITKTQVMKEMLASDESSDEDEQMTDDEDQEDLSSAPSSIAKLHAKLVEDSLNPMTALIARRKAKAWRKLKRRANRQQIGEEVEKDFCAQLDNIGLNSIFQVGMETSVGFKQGFNLPPLTIASASAEEIDENL